LRELAANRELQERFEADAARMRTLLALGSDHFFAEDPEIDLKTAAMAHTIIRFLEGNRVAGSH
jgi:hypothetical protein